MNTWCMGMAGFLELHAYILGYGWIHGGTSLKLPGQQITIATTTKKSLRTVISPKTDSSQGKEQGTFTEV